MQIPKSAIFVAGLSVALFFVTILVITLTAREEEAASPKPIETKAAPVLLEYKPEAKIHLILRGYNRNESPEPMVVVATYSVYDGL